MQHPSVSISLREKECGCVCVYGGGVLAGVEQSCNELILEREREREWEKESDRKREAENRRGLMTG